VKGHDKSKSRRDFLKKGASGLAGMAVLPAVLGSAARGQTEEKTEETKKKYKIVTRKLGNTGIMLPVVSYGAGRTRDPELLRAALDAGIVHLDTAHSYGRGQNEELIGSVIKDRPRDSFVIATKVTGPEDRKTGFFTKDATSTLFQEKFDTSMKRLGLEYIDILYIHSVVTKEAVMYEPFLNVMQKLKKEGRVKHLGVSTHGNEHEVIRAVTESKIHEVVLTAYNFRQPHVKEMDAAMAEAAEAGIGIVAMKTQAGVYWDQEQQNPINPQAALKWVIKNKNVHTTIPGISTFEHLAADMAVMEDLELSPEEKKDLQLGQRLGLPGLYCRQCGSCLPQCGREIAIPTLMRSYMYMYGYRDLRAAKEALAKIDLLDIPCSSCGDCSVTCSMGFDIKNKIEDMAWIKHVPDDFAV